MLFKEVACVVLVITKVLLIAIIKCASAINKSIKIKLFIATIRASMNSGVSVNQMLNGRIIKKE